MACRICRRPNHNARSCKKKGRKLQRKKFSRKRNPAFRRNIDENIREAERRWRSTLSDDNRMRYLMQLKRSGAFDLARLRLAAVRGAPWTETASEGVHLTQSEARALAPDAGFKEIEIHHRNTRSMALIERPEIFATSGFFEGSTKENLSDEDIQFAEAIMDEVDARPMIVRFDDDMLSIPPNGRLESVITWIENRAKKLGVTQAWAVIGREDGDVALGHDAENYSFIQALKSLGYQIFDTNDSFYFMRKNLDQGQHRNPELNSLDYQYNPALLDSTRDMDLSYSYNPALLDSTRDMDLSYSYNPALLDSTRDMDLSYSYNPDLDDAQTGIWQSDDVWNQSTEVLDPEVDYGSAKQAVLRADWDQLARILGGQQMYYMKKRALMKVLQNDPTVDLAIRKLIDAINSASDDVMISG